jgi:transcriptional regulator with XRE-family HTH domain
MNSTNREDPELLHTRRILQMAIEITGLSKYAFAKQAKMSGSGLNRYLNGKQDISVSKLNEILAANGLRLRVRIDLLNPVEEHGLGGVAANLDS